MQAFILFFLTYNNNDYSILETNDLLMFFSLFFIENYQDLKEYVDLFESSYPSNGVLNNKINPNNIENIYIKSSNFSYDMVKYLLKILKLIVVKNMLLYKL